MTRSFGSVTRIPSSGPRLDGRGGLVVCEAQDTAVEGQSLLHTSRALFSLFSLSFGQLGKIRRK